MRRFLFILMLLAWSPLSAFSSHQNWLWGSRAYETVPYFEGDLELGTSYAEQGPWTQEAAFRMGWTDRWLVSAVVNKDGAGSFSPGARSRFRFGETGQWPLDLALQGEWLRRNGKNIFLGGPVAAFEFAEHSLVFNPFFPKGQGMDFRAGWRSPYITYGLKAGLEYQWLSQGKQHGLGPQLVFNAPGDLSLSVGAWFPLETNSPEPWRLRLRLDYTLFPSP